METLYHGGSTSILPWRTPTGVFPVFPKACPRAFLSLPTLASTPTRALLCRARKRKSSADTVLAEEQPLVSTEEAELPLEDEDEDEGEFGVEFHDDEILEDEDDKDVDFEDDDSKPEDAKVGDGGAGGGISLSGTSWDKKALALAEEVCSSLGSEFKIYAFRTTPTSIGVRIEKLTEKSGSPPMSDIEAFAKSYQTRLDAAASSGSIPDDLSVEVSSPGVERVLRIPDDLERFKDRSLYVRYMTEDDTPGSPIHENEGVFSLVSYDPEHAYCIWGLADVRANRERLGKGRRLSKKQKEWRLQTSFSSLRLVRIYFEC